MLRFSHRQLDMSQRDTMSTNGFRQQLLPVEDNSGRCNYHLGPFLDSQNQGLKPGLSPNCQCIQLPAETTEQCCPKPRHSDSALAPVFPNFPPVDDKDYPSECFPRCEYQARFTETSAFQMSDPEHWGTYLRNTPFSGGVDRLTALELNEYQNPYTNAPNKGSFSVGTFHSPWRRSKYKAIFYKTPVAPSTSTQPAYLYDMLLSYKRALCLKVEKYFNEKEVADNKLEVYSGNDYPCIMVKIQELNNLLKVPTSLYEIVIAHFVALTNKVAHSRNIPIELVMRPSFGHNIPSVAQLATSFRINIGTVPEIYAQVLVQSLIKLNNEFLVPLFNTTFRLNLGTTEINDHNKRVENYNDHNKVEENSQSVSTWSEKEPLVKMLIKVGHHGGATVSDRIMRKRKYIHLLASYATEELGNLKPDLSNPLNKILGKLIYSETDIVHVTKDEYKNISLLRFSEAENPAIKEDIQFWRIMQEICLRLTVKSHHELSEAIEARKVLGLYKMLERANLEFIKNSSYQEAEDGCGSDSDCEVDSTPVLYSKKVIVTTGVRAINLAHFVSICYLRELGYSPQTQAEKSYYETNDSVATITDTFTFLPLRTRSEQHRGDATIRHIDLNHCAANGPESLSLEDCLNRISVNDVVVLDYTSTDTEKISMSVNLFFTKVEVVILVSSGLKNEQLGADMNPYGTIRIVTKDRSTLDELYFVLSKVLELGEEVLPKELHHIRKAYKDAGAVVTNEAIYKQLYRKRRSNVDHCKSVSWKTNV